MNIDVDSISCVLDELHNGLFILDRNYTIIYWNKYMSHHTQKKAHEVIGKNLFEIFDNLPKEWLKKKIHSAFLLKINSFTSWEQRPWIFPFPNNRIIDSRIEFMFQNCVFTPIKKGKHSDIEYLSVTIYDATELALKNFEIQKTLIELTESNITDSLTKIHNRRHIQETLEQEFIKYQRHQHDVGLILIDIDYFKKINDEFGHLAGDEILRNIALNIKNLMRKCDFVGRFGGEEFAVILPMTKIQGVYLAAERIRNHVENITTVFQENEMKITLSLGLSLLSEKHKKIEDWINEADHYLYESKRNGRNRTTDENTSLLNQHK